VRVLARAWQMLLKGIAEVEASGRPLAAAEMVLVRLAYAADLPTPDEVIRALDDKAPGAGAERAGSERGSAERGGAAPPGAPAISASARLETSRGGARGSSMAASQPAVDPLARRSEPAPEAPALAIGRFEDLIALAAQKRDLTVKAALERDVRLVRCEDGRLEIAVEPSASKMLANDLARKFSLWTGRRWMVVVSAEAGQPTLRSQVEARAAELKTGVRADPLVQAVLARFPGAEIVGVRTPDQPAAVPDPEDAMPEPPPADDGAAYGADWQADDAEREP
jgi:DNA polymerase III subunit gamma/tau